MSKLAALGSKWTLLLDTEVGCEGLAFHTYHTISLVFEKVASCFVHFKVLNAYSAALCLLQLPWCFLHQLLSNCWLLCLNGMHWNGMDALKCKMECIEIPFTGSVHVLVLRLYFMHSVYRCA